MRDRKVHKSTRFFALASLQRSRCRTPHVTHNNISWWWFRVTCERCLVIGGKKERPGG